MTPSRPVRAMQGAAVVVAAAIALRVPAMRARFDAAVNAGGAGAGTIAGSAGRPRMTAPPQRDTVVSRAPAPSASAVGEPHDMPPATILVAAPVDRDPRPEMQRRRPALAVLAPLVRSQAQLSQSAAPLAVATPPPPAAPVPLPPTGLPQPQLVMAAAAPDPGALATAAYARLAAGDRRSAVRLFDAALTGDDPRAPAWRRDRDALTRRWSASAYSIVRGSGPPGLAAEPVLGGGQSGGAVAFTPDPLSPRPVALTVRGTAGHDDAGRSAFVAAGFEWHPLTGVTLAAERRFAVGPAARGDWSLRLAAGADRTRGRLRLTVYGEGGVVGTTPYAAVQGRAAAVVHDGKIALEPGVGAWASLQHDHASVDRVDLGPGVVIRSGPLAVEADYRVRVAGNAAPGSGPVLTLGAAF